MNENKKMKLIEKFLSWIVAVGGLILSIIGISTKSDFGKQLVYLMIIMDTLILVCLGVYVTISYYKNRTIVEKKDKIILNNEHVIEKKGIEYEEQKRHMWA